MKKCTPISNTECRKRDLSPTEAPPVPPTPTAAAAAPADIGNRRESLLLNIPGSVCA